MSFATCSSMTRLMTCATILGVASLLAGCTGAAAQQSDTNYPSAASADAQMEASPTARRYSVPTDNSDIETGGAIILVKAPLAKVLEEIQRYDNYKNIFPRIKDTRVVERQGTSTDVYLRAPVMDGSVALWAIARFSEPRSFGKGGKQVSSRYIKGNLESWRGVWKLEPISENETSLRVELYVIPKLPVPDAWITPELMWASEKAVVAVRDIVEKGESSVRDD